MQKNFILPRGTVSLSVEAFNLFNFANVTLGAAQMVYGPGTIVQTAANGQSTVVPAPIPATFMRYKDESGALHYEQRKHRRRPADDPVRAPVPVLGRER